MNFLYIKHYVNIHKEFHFNQEPIEKMKEKLTALDLEVLVNELEESLVGLRLNNIYNIQDAHKQFLLKFQKPDVKQNLVIDNGLKIYVTKYTRNTPPAPSGFIVKMRNYLSNKKLTGLKKIPNERIIVLQFSNGMFYLSLEFFSSGNLIVLDENLKILQVFRVNEEHGIQIGGFYNLFNPLELFSEENEINEQKLSENYLEEDLKKMTVSYLQKLFNAESEKVNAFENKNNKKFKVLSISKLLYLNYPTLTNQLIQEKLKQSGYKVNEACTSFFDSDEQEINKILDILRNCAEDVEKVLKTSKENRLGYLTKVINPSFLESEPESKELNPKFLYDSYSPFEPTGLEYDTISNGYINAIDTFYSTLEVLKISTKTNNFISQQNRKLDQAKQENFERLKQLEEASHSNEAKGNAIIANVDIIDELIETMNKLIYENQMDWKAAELWIQSQQKRKGKLSDNIRRIRLPLKLEENKFTVLLPIDNDDDESESSDSDSDSSSDSDSDLDAETPKKEKKMISIAIDFSKSAYTNASTYFSLKKEVESKKTKTLTNQKKAMKSIENKFNKNLNKKMNQETTPNITRLAENFFFQKFHWFITTDGYLCILLNDDNIYWKYAESDDFYLTCESSLMNKNSKVLIKNLRKEDTLSERAILEASQYCLAASEAWNKKINGSSCLYCKVSNISKFVDNDFDKNGVLENGKFFIIDESKLIRTSPVQIVMGFGLMWRKKSKSETKEYVEHIAQAEDVIDFYNNKAELIQESIDKNVLENSDSESQDEEEQHVELEEVEEIKNAHSETIANIFDEYEKQAESMKPKPKKSKKKLEKKNSLTPSNSISEDSFKRQERARQLEEKSKFQTQKVMKLMNTPKPLVHYDLMLKELSPLLKLSNIPEQDDLFDYDIVPMFAPWMALSKCKFKIKILNGTNKKMKNCHDIMVYFERHMKLDLESKDKERIWPIESDKIKEYPVESLVTCFFVDKFKCSLPGSNVVSNGGGKGSKNNKSQKAKGKGKKK